MTRVTDFFISTAYAQATAPGAVIDPANTNCTPFFSDSQLTAPKAGLGFYCIESYLSDLTFIVIGFAASIALIMLLINGIRYMTGPVAPGGSSDAAKKGIQSALIGLAVCLLTYVLLNTFIQAITL